VGAGAVGPISVVGSAAAPCTLFLIGDGAGFISAIGNEVFSVPVGSALFADLDECALQPPTAFIAGAGLCFLTPASSGNSLPVADVNFTGSLIISLLDGPIVESVKTVTDAGAGITYTIDASYLTGGHADQAIWCNPRTGTVTQLNLPDARLPMNKGRVIPLVDGNGVSEGSPIHLVATAPNPLNGVVGGTTLLSSARAQWVVRSDGTQWDVAQMPRADGPTAITQTTWFIDPQNSSLVASDANTGLTAATPLRTIAEMSRRLGTTEPDYGTQVFTVTVTLMSDTNASDPWNLRPVSGIMVVVATLTQQQVGVIQGFSARVQGPPAVKPIISTVSFASWVPFVNMWVQTTTGPNQSWSRVMADIGGGSANVTQPAVDCRSPLGVISPDLRTPLAGDAFTIWKPGVVHVTVTGGLSTQGTVIMQNAAFTAVAGGATAQCNLLGTIIAQQCISPAYVSASSQSNEAALGNNNSGKPAFTNSHLLGGCDLYDHFFMGGSILGPFVLRAEGSQALHGGGMIIDGTVTPQSFTGGGRTQLGDVGIFCSALNLLGGGQGRQTTGVLSLGTDPTAGVSVPPAVWGPTIWPMKSLGNLLWKTTLAQELKTGGNLTLAGAATGFAWIPGAGTYSAGPTVVLGAMPAAAAAIDAAGGVFDPGHQVSMFKEA
jgi:hypothetical protein